MPGKHVHFSDAYYCATTPSPSYSTSTLPSSTGPLTPPPLGFGSPYYTTPLPGTDAVLHPCLGVNAGQVIFDLSLPPSNSLRFTTKPINLDAPATNPASESISVTCALLPWTITIVPRSLVGSFVTVRDVFETLYAALRMPATAAEYAQLPNTTAQEMVNRAFRLRCKRDGPAEIKKGLKRIDFLAGRTTFRGFKVVNKGVGGWILEVA